MFQLKTRIIVHYRLCVEPILSLAIAMIFNLSDLQIGKVLSAISYVLYFVKEKIEGYNITER